MKLSLKVPAVLALLLVVARVNGEEENTGAIEKIRFGLNHIGKKTTLIGEETFPLFFACGTNGNGDHKATGLNTIFYELYINLLPTYASAVSQLGSESYDAYVRDFIKICKPKYLAYDHYALLEGGKYRPGKWGQCANLDNHTFTSSTSMPR